MEGDFRKDSCWFASAFSLEDLDIFRSYCPRYDLGLVSLIKENEDQIEPTTPVRKKHVRVPLPFVQGVFRTAARFPADTDTSACGDVQNSWVVTFGTLTTTGTII